MVEIPTSVQSIRGKVIKEWTIKRYEGECVKQIKNVTVNEDDFSEDLRSVASILTLLTESERGIFSQLLYQYRLLFSNKPGRARGYEHQIKLITNEPGIRQTYPIPFQLREATGVAIMKGVDNGVIERAVSRYCNPLRIVMKEDKTVRVCLDARFINRIIEDDHESPPLINESLQKFHGSQWFSKLDLTQGYWQVPLHKNSRQYTGFLFE